MDIGNIPHLLRRELEARLLRNLLPVMEAAFGKEEVRRVLGEAIAKSAAEEGRECAVRFGDNSLEKLSAVVSRWSDGNALGITMRRSDTRCLVFDVTHCAYAELYERLGMRDLGAVLSCERDFAFIEGFNPCIHLTRRQTLMEGYSCCDFRYEIEERATCGNE